MSLFICIKLKDSELCRVAGHAPSARQQSLSLAVPRVAGNRQLSIELNGIVSLVVLNGALIIHNNEKN